MDKNLASFLAKVDESLSDAEELNALAIKTGDPAVIMLAQNNHLALAKSINYLDSLIGAVL